MPSVKDFVWISQDYFDDVCLENRDTFDLDESQAIYESLAQLQSPTSTASTTMTPILEHLTHSFPTSEDGIRIRDQRTDFLRKLQHLRDVSASSSLEQSEAVAATLEYLNSQINLATEDRSLMKMFRFLFIKECGIDIYLALWKNLMQTLPSYTAASPTVGLLLRTINSMLSDGGKVEQSKLFFTLVHTSWQDTVPRYITLWLESYQQLLQEQTSSRANIHSDEEGGVGSGNADLQLDLLHVAYWACKQCEQNKQRWMDISVSINTSSFTLSTLLVESLRQVVQTNPNQAEGGVIRSNNSVVVPVCRLVTVLCTFDDFRVSHEPIMQSSHQNVSYLYQAGMITMLNELLLVPETDWIPSILTALRSMSIQDDIVQSIVSTGILEHSSRIFQNCLERTAVKSSSDPPISAVITAAIGLFRNLCANDDIKTTLCLDNDQSIVSSLVLAMATYPDIGLLQEHGCGVIAAMALRRPANAARLVALGAHLSVLQAMQWHRDRLPLQRQAALAVRNLVSRSPELVHVLLQSDAEPILRGMAAKHVACQDEVYAALRDLGVPVSMLHVQHDVVTGEIEVLSHRRNFGEGTVNFRPVYDD